MKDALSRACAATFNPTPSFSQAISGVGYPATTQLNTAVCPSTFVSLLGDWEISGATINTNSEKEIESQQTKRYSREVARLFKKTHSPFLRLITVKNCRR